ncbi:MAG: segregation/condensation protein A [Candidatus Latescibacteria bacterium]|nr:segregation/condensation protein A [Candidatus Latescibacterota bacterium]
MSSEYQVKTETFSGPIELLLYLVRKNEVDIFDIPLQKITDDYLNYIQQVKDYNIEISSDFLLMAVVLIRLKVWRLLPSTKEGEEIPEAKVSLEDIITEYKKYAGLAGFLSDLELKQSQLFPRRGQVFEELPDAAGDVYVLISAFQKILEKNVPKPGLEIVATEIKLEDKLIELRSLITEKTRISFDEIVTQTRTLIEIIIVFIALLELVRMGEIRVRQNAEFSTIILEKKLPEANHASQSIS